jgi:hypothetical protein
VIDKHRSGDLDAETPDEEGPEEESNNEFIGV